MLVAGAVVAVTIAGLAAAASMLHARRRSWLVVGHPGLGDVRLALLAGAANAGAILLLSLVAVDLARNPF